MINRRRWPEPQSYIDLNVTPLIFHTDCTVSFNIHFEDVNPAVVRETLLEVNEVIDVTYLFRTHELKVTMADSSLLSLSHAYEDCIEIMRIVDRTEYLLRDISESMFAALDEDY